MDNSIKVSFLENEIKLAQYYTGLRDKIGALNVAFVGFILSIYKTASENEVVFFHLLIALGFFSFAACLRAGIAYDYHFNNYETFLKNDDEFRALIEENRKAYKTNKGLTAWPTLGASKMSTLFFWAIVIGSLGPIVALLAFSPCC